MHLFRNFRRTGVLIAAGAILTGCTINIGGETTGEAPESVVPEASTDPTGENTDVAAAGDGIDAEPVIPPLGEFDSESPEFNQFNPCTEIPEDYLDEVGLLDRQTIEGYTDDDGRCGFGIDPSYGTAILKLVGNDWGFEGYEHISGEITWSVLDSLSPIMLHRDSMFDGTACGAIVETVGGTFEVMFQSYLFEESTHDSCVEAERWLKLILEMDGKHGV